MTREAARGRCRLARGREGPLGRDSTASLLPERMGKPRLAHSGFGQCLVPSSLGPHGEIQ